MRLIDQTQLGGMDAGPGQVGNCYPACIATLLGVELSNVPHVYELHPHDLTGAFNAMADFLRERGWSYVMFTWPLHPEYAKLLRGSLAVVSGPSPRLENTEHAVIGRILDYNDWELFHDPHPTRDGLFGVPTTIEIYFKPLRSSGA